MIITDTLKPSGVRTAAAVGYFDGMHRGHMSVLRATLEQAEKHGLSPAVLTFDMSRFRSPGKGRKDLSPSEFRRKKAEELGFEQYAELDFSSICGMSCEEFVDGILGPAGLNAGAVVCGDDFRFGRGRAGDAEYLGTLCGQRGISVISVPAVMEDGEPVSTSRIKKLIEDGDMETANRLLGYPYFIEGTVTHGNHLAHRLGFPTANVEIHQDLVSPRRGVYLSLTEADGRKWKSITNIGVRPTVTEDVIPVCETHLVDYSGDLYGRTLKTELLSFIRPEKQFSSVEELKQTVLSNVEYARSASPEDFLP